MWKKLLKIKDGVCLEDLLLDLTIVSSGDDVWKWDGLKAFCFVFFII